jgi:outer membrane immunogenic protein
MRKILLASTILAAMSGGALAADEIAAPAGTAWGGAYFGWQAGWASLDPDSQPGLGLPAANFIQPSSHGLIGGVHLGYNFQFDRIVVGVEGDVNRTDLSATEPGLSPAFNYNAGSDWNASIRARLGFAADRILVFATGGYAVADYDGFTRVVPTGQTFPDNQTLHGYAIGGGIEYAWTENRRVRIEYRHLRFGKETMTYDVPYIVEPDIDMVLVGMSWKF